MWSNIFSIDAVIIAMLWHVLLARMLGVQTGFRVTLVLGLTVWTIYLLDHLLDTRLSSWPGDPPRKIFFRRHWHGMLGVTGLSFVLTATLGPLLLSSAVLWVGLKTGLLVAGYFLVVHMVPSRWRPRWPRELVVAAFFAWGVIMPIWVNDAVAHPALILVAAPFLLLCWVNCCAVEVWEWQAGGGFREIRPNDLARYIADRVPLASGAVGLLVVLLTRSHTMVPLWAAPYAMSSISMVAIAQSKRDRTVAGSCLLMDLALYSPVAVFLALWLSGAGA